MRSFTLLVTMVIAGVAPARVTATEVKSKEQISKNYLGVGGGMITGYGFSYRRWVPEGKWGLQCTVFPFYLEQKYNDSPDDYYDVKTGYSNIGLLSTGGVYLRQLYDEGDFLILCYCGGNLHTVYENSKYILRNRMYDYYTNTYTYDTTDIDKRTMTHRVSAGGGFGGDLKIWRFNFSLLIGALGYYKTQTHEKGILPSIEASVLFGL